MIYNTIPIPQFSFTDIPESEAKQIADAYFQATYSLSFGVTELKDEIRNLLFRQESREDKIVILSYLINRLTERIVTLPVPKSPIEIRIREQDTTPSYTAILHFLYRLIEQEEITIPKDLFDAETFNNVQILLLAINDSLEQVKIDNPDNSEGISTVQNEVKKSAGKFLWMGKEDWAKIIIGGIISTSIKEGIAPLVSPIFLIIQGYLNRLLNP